MLNDRPLTKSLLKFVSLISLHKLATMLQTDYSFIGHVACSISDNQFLYFCLPFKPIIQ